MYFMIIFKIKLFSFIKKIQNTKKLLNEINSITKENKQYEKLKVINFKAQCVAGVYL
jgi:hypothetical protein